MIILCEHITFRVSSAVLTGLQKAQITPQNERSFIHTFRIESAFASFPHITHSLLQSAQIRLRSFVLKTRIITTIHCRNNQSFSHPEFNEILLSSPHIDIKKPKTPSKSWTLKNSHKSMQDPKPRFISLEEELQILLVEAEELFTPEPREKKITRRKFTWAEDELLLVSVARYGTRNWAEISRLFPSRSIRQVRERWRDYLNPSLVVGNWTQAEEQLLVDRVAEIGPRWSVIAKLFPGRSDVSVKGHYLSLKTRMTKELHKFRPPERRRRPGPGQADQFGWNETFP
jgi:hypothetical protein